MQQDTKQAGNLLVDTLLKLIREEPAENQVIPASLVLRRSTQRQSRARVRCSGARERQAKSPSVSNARICMQRLACASVHHYA